MTNAEQTLEAGVMLKLNSSENFDLSWLTGQAVLIKVLANAPS
jgi:hypothetical protein